MAKSSAEAEYRALADTTAELAWVSYVLQDIGVYLTQPPIFFCDSLSALFMTTNLVLHARIKPIETDYHFVREKVALEGPLLVSL